MMMYCGLHFERKDDNYFAVTNPLFVYEGGINFLYKPILNLISF